MAMSAMQAAQDKGPVILAVGWILIAIPGFFVALRLYCKIMLARGLGWDDAVCVFSWVSSKSVQLMGFCLTTSAFATRLHGLGHQRRANGCNWKTC